MTATVCGDPIAVTNAETHGVSTKQSPKMEAVFVKCDCCGLTEECTPAYIERHGGNWICGLCSEAIKYEILRSDSLMTAEEAMENHKNVCRKFTALRPPPNPTVHMITAMRQILKRSLESTARSRSTPSSPTINTPAISRSATCFPSLSGS